MPALATLTTRRAFQLAACTDRDIHFVLEAYPGLDGKDGRPVTPSYRETDPLHSTEAEIVAAIVSGEIANPVQVLKVSPVTGTSRDVSEHIAELVVEKARAEGADLTRGAFDFCQALDEIPIWAAEMVGGCLVATGEEAA